MEQELEHKTKKKKTHFFEIYISKLLKLISDKNGITSNAKQQLNSALCIILKNISSIVHNLIIVSKKKTITIKEISNAINITLTGELLSNAIKYGDKTLELFNKDIDKKGSRQNKAGIIFPPSIVEKFLRNFGYSKVMITNNSPVYLASIIEYITSEILKYSTLNCKHVRLTIRDIELSVRNNIELDKLFKKFNVTFLGGGVLPFIHTSLISSTRSNAIKTIKKQQKTSDTLILSKLTFERIVRNVFKSLTKDTTLKISKDVFIVLQHFIEQYIVDILRDANYLTVHANRIKLLPIDLSLILSFHNKTQNPYNSNIKNSIQLLSIENINIEDDELC